MQSVIYSVFASVATIIITTIIGLFLYENVLLKESQQRKKYMLEAFRKKNLEFKSGHEIKLKKGYFKLKTVLIIIGRYLKNLNSNFKIYLSNFSSKFKFSFYKILINLNN